MAISVYTDPGAYIQEVIAQGAVTLGQVPLAVTLIGVASPNRVYSNEPIVRGQLTQTLVVAATSPHNAPLTVPSNMDLSSTQITRDGTVIPNSRYSYSSASNIVIDSSVYISTSVYVITYIAPSSTMDTPINAPVVKLDMVGSFPNVTSFVIDTDYQLTSGKVDWSLSTEAELTGIPVGPFNLATNSNIKFNLDGLPDLTVSVVGATPAATTAAEVVSALNAAMVANINYGVPYTNAASVSAGKVKLTGVVLGQLGSVTLKQASSASANMEVFGIASSALPLTVNGTGMQPVIGSVYYITYEITRPVTDYNTPFQFYSSASAYQIIGWPDFDNPLANYVNICFDQGAPSVFCIIATSTADIDMITALGASEAKVGMTEILPISTSLNVQIATLQSVTNMSSLLEKKPRRGWYGMARGTQIGDQSTPNTLLYLAGVTLQVPGDSPGRGRSIVTAPCECQITITLLNGSTLPIQLDGTALAAASAAVLTGFVSASTSLLRKTLAGFDVITDYSDQQRHLLASGGVSVVSLRGGVPTLTDPITTEVAGGGLQEFSEISVMVQKDKVAAEVGQQIDTNLVAIVPDDLSDFISDIKIVIANTLRGMISSGDIGNYTNANGTQRDINLQTDIQASQSTNDKTQFNFRYWFNGKYPAKRFFGQFSIDNPFFAPSQGNNNLSP